MFNYNSINNIFFSKGNIKLKDKNDNIYKFSELYIDEKKKKKIVGSDAKMFFNDSNLKSDPENNPRLFANSLAISEDVTSVQKGYSLSVSLENDKCPPWELRAKKNSSQ